MSTRPKAPPSSKILEARLRAEQFLMENGLTVVEIKAIWDSRMVDRLVGGGKLVQRPALYGWSCHGTKMADEQPVIKMLRQYGLINTGKDGRNYWLTASGRAWQASIKEGKPITGEMTQEIDNLGRAYRNTKSAVQRPDYQVKALSGYQISSSMMTTKFGHLKTLAMLSHEMRKHYGITLYDIQTIGSAELDISQFNLMIVKGSAPCDTWPDHPTAGDKRLLDRGLMYQKNGQYILTKSGKALYAIRKRIVDGMPAKPTNTSCHEIIKPSKPALTKEIAEVDVKHDNMDINVGRDGLLTTASKLWYVWTHKEEIQQAALVRQYREFVEGHQQISDAADQIATSNQRVARKLTEQQLVVENHSLTTVELQRAQNDMYWASDQSAFWLNPNIYRDGAFDLTAAPAAPPEWWTMPEEYQARFKLPNYNQVLDEALALPPEKAIVSPQHTTKEPVGPVYQPPQFTMGSPESSREKDRIFETVFNTIDMISDGTLDIRDFDFRIPLEDNTLCLDDLDYYELDSMISDYYGLNLPFSIQYVSLNEIVDFIFNAIQQKSEVQIVNDRLLALSVQYTHIGIEYVDASANSAYELFGLNNNQEVDRWINNRRGRIHFIEMRGSEKYGRFLRMLDQQEQILESLGTGAMGPVGISGPPGVKGDPTDPMAMTYSQTELNMDIKYNRSSDPFDEDSDEFYDFD